MKIWLSPLVSYPEGGEIPAGYVAFAREAADLTYDDCIKSLEFDGWKPGADFDPWHDKRRDQDPPHCWAQNKQERRQEPSLLTNNTQDPVGYWYISGHLRAGRHRARSRPSWGL